MQLIFLLLLSLSNGWSQERVVQIRDNQLVVDSEPQPQLFGAEVQYFRLRGAYGPNVPRQTVIDLWNKALDKVVEAKMNAISFYIPWDFHEYAEGKFDFTGTADQDGDGNADYPSRDVITFFKLIEAHGIKKIMVRPGPYINAEWGFLGFGAIPEWFHEKFPESHMTVPWGWSTKLYDYLNPNFLKYTQIWFETLYKQVLQSHMGPGKPIVFLQIDNETNYQWQSIFKQDYSPRTIDRYREFLKETYGSIEKLNKAQGTTWGDWNQAYPSVEPGKNLEADRDWYRFSDETMFRYLHEIRKMWENLGVHEPQVLFTLAESYNATGNGILPNYKLRNSPLTTGTMTVNLYPKTFEVPGRDTLLNFPFKTDLDVKSATEATTAYFGSKQEWVMGPEIQAGWWRNINVSPESRQQTYLTVIGHGLKSMFVYYFNEGQNWNVEWAANKIRPLFESLKQEWHLEKTPAAELTNEFWGELQARSDRMILMGFDVRRLMQINIHDDETLYFDSPLDEKANPRDHFSQLKMLGEKLFSPYQDFLARAVEANDPVAFVKDSDSHAPSPERAIDSLFAAADWSGGLLGYLMNSCVNPQILHGDISSEEAFNDPQLFVHVDSMNSSPRTLELLSKGFSRGQNIVNFLGGQLSQVLGFDVKHDVFTHVGPQKLYFYDSSSHKIEFAVNGPIFTYELDAEKNKTCQPILFLNSGNLEKVVGYRCSDTFVQIGALIFEDYNSSNYAYATDLAEKNEFLKNILSQSKIQTKLQIGPEANRVVAFARQDPKQEAIWITVKTGDRESQYTHLMLSPDFLRLGLQTDHVIQFTDKFSVTDLLTDETQILSFEDLSTHGFSLHLKPEGSTVFLVHRVSN